MNNLFFGIITLAFVVSACVAACVFIYVLIELRGTLKTIKEFLKTTEDNLYPTLEELRKSLRSARNVADNATAITEDVRTLSASVREVGENVRHVSRVVNAVTSSPFVQVSGLKAGIKAATDVFVKGFLSKKQKVQ
jgi:uncharacterized protein YoxC